MACKLICHKCERVLKEEGDENKKAQAEYRVYENVWNCKVKAGEYSVILCLGCNQFSLPDEFED